MLHSTSKIKYANMTRSQVSTRSVAIKYRLACGKLMAQQILTQFDHDKIASVLRQKMGYCAAAFNNTLACTSIVNEFTHRVRQ